MKIITTLHYNRPEYTSLCLDRLRQCDGIGEYHILAVAHQGASTEVVDMLRGIDFADVRLWQPTPPDADPVHRLSWATRELISAGFAFADYVIHIEDDILLSPDALRYFEHCDRTYRNDPAVFSVTGYNVQRSSLKSPELAGMGFPEPLTLATAAAYPYAHRVIRHQWFHPWGWATWRDRFAPATATWPDIAWDGYMNGQARGDRCEIIPILARTQNIGAHGVCVPNPIWHSNEQFNPVWAGDLEYLAPGAFWEGPTP